MRWLIALTVVGCSGGDDGTPPDTTPVCTHVQNLRLVRGKADVFGTVSGSRFDGLLCVEGRPDIDCATTNGAANFEICAPDGEFGLRLTKTGFERVIYWHGPGPSSTVPYSVPDDAFAGPMIWMPIGGQYPPTPNGHLVIIVADGAEKGVGGATLQLSPSSGLTVVYAFNGRPDTTRSTTAASGVAFVANVPPGMYDITSMAPTHPSCTFYNGGFVSPAAPAQVRIPVTAGYTNIVRLRCVP